MHTSPGVPQLPPDRAHPAARARSSAIRIRALRTLAESFDSLRKSLRIAGSKRHAASAFLEDLDGLEATDIPKPAMPDRPVDPKAFEEIGLRDLGARNIGHRNLAARPSPA